jgi:hypothetical protein
MAPTTTTTIGTAKVPRSSSQSQTVLSRKPVHLGQRMLRLDGGSAFRTSFFCPTMVARYLSLSSVTFMVAGEPSLTGPLLETTVITGRWGGG